MCAHLFIFISLGMNLSRNILFSLLYIIVIAHSDPIVARQDTNPMLEMIGKEYHEYFDEYESLCDSLFAGDSLSRVKLIRYFAEASAAAPASEWDLDRRRMESHVRFYESRGGGFEASEQYTADRFAKDLLSIAHEAEKKGFKYMWLRSLFNVADAYRIFERDYEQAFKYYLEVAARLEHVSQREFPWKLFMYREIADFYYSFREYKDATVFYRKIAEDSDVTYKNNHRLYPALNGLALCYRHAEQYDRSDSCFLQILSMSAPCEEDRYVWEGIAGGGIGYNHYLRGDMEKALSWMEPALAKMKRPNDDSYTSNLAVNIANIYLGRNDIHQAEKYLNIALDYFNRTRIPEKNSNLLQAMARYHSLKGNRREATAYLDSSLRATKKEGEAYSGLVLRRVEQQLRAVDQRLYEKELFTEKLRSTYYKRTAFWVSSTLAVILLLALLLFIYYHRTRQAYHELVRRSQQWANVSTDEEKAAELCPDADSDKTSPVLSPNVADRTIMEKIEQLMEEKRLFTNADLSLNTLATELGLDRRHVSNAINVCTNKNFFSYLNEYRVKEAIRLLSVADKLNLTIDSIAFDSGFNDRRTFHRVFKQFTGLTPGAFKESL